MRGTEMVNVPISVARSQESRTNSMPQTWFITGATRGLGVEIAKAALHAGHQVVATGRSRAQVMKSLGEDGARLLTLEHDVADDSQTKSAVAAAIAKFGTIDVLVNNAG